ncbi:MAG: polyribonucleotide nucleotidyltransferase [Chlamydiales bacterium]
MKEHTTTISVAGKSISFSTGKIARQANGAVLLTCGETTILSTICAKRTPSADVDFLPLRVDYQEKFSSAGKTLGGFIKREGRPTERETLLSRLIDRPIRPLFPNGYYNETQILSYVLSYDGIHSPDPLAICAASAAIAISDVPFTKPLAAVQIGLIKDTFVINPTIQEKKVSTLDLILAGTEDSILMIEGYSDFLSEEQVITAMEEGHAAIKEICQGIKEWQSQVGKDKLEVALREPSHELINLIEEKVKNDLVEALQIKDKQKRELALSIIEQDVMVEYAPETNPTYCAVDIKISLKKIIGKYLRANILTKNERCDGRNSEEIRPISIDIGILARTHGSVLFTRGETQSISVCTLGGETMAQRFEDLNEGGTQRFYLQYFFPPFSVGEVGRIGAPGRREVGHGKLAEKALLYSIPTSDVFPYIIRLESNITESNGSSSMASVCGGCLALMDAGVPIKRPVVGIAMGLLLDENNNHVILSDILGIEDAYGDMDFKITGDEKGITAFQMDSKVEGITVDIMRRALAQARQGLAHILQKVLSAHPKPRASLSEHAPKIITMQIKPSKIAIVIGPGGKQIRSIIEETGADIKIDDDGRVCITAMDQEGLNKAKDIIHSLTMDVEIGKTYTGEITGIKDFGVFVRIGSKEGLCHISELSNAKITNIYDAYTIGSPLEVEVLDVNDRGQIKLSARSLLSKSTQVNV